MDSHGTDSADSTSSTGSSTASGGSSGPDATSSDATGASTGIDDGDEDGDGIPDEDDPFPDDPALPGVVEAGLVYMHTREVLATMDPPASDDPDTAETVATVGVFTFPDGGAGPVLDIAIDRFGVLYAVASTTLHACHPQTAACHLLGTLDVSYNTMTFVPRGVLDAEDDTLLLGTWGGAWRRADWANGVVNVSTLGEIGPGHGARGDAAWHAGDVYAVVFEDPADWDRVARLDPADGTIEETIATMDGYLDLYGLAGTDDLLVGFAEDGRIVTIDPSTGDFEEVAGPSDMAWTGAASVHHPGD